MATVNPTISRNQAGGDDSILVATWTPLTTANADGATMKYPEWADRTFSVTGTFGAGGTLVIQGSNDGTNWFTLNSAAGATAASFTAAGIKTMIELPLFVRPFVSAGDGTTSLSVILVARRANPLHP